MEEHIVEDIQQRLTAAEIEHDVKVIHVCESGNRAWGFASPDSDYDIRFIYAHKSEWYLSFDVESRRDVIEYPIVDDIDIGGWDIRPVAAIEFHMDENELTRADLETCIGTRAQVLEVLNRKRGLSIEVIRNLHEGLGIPLESLIARPKESRAS